MHIIPITFDMLTDDELWLISLMHYNAEATRAAESAAQAAATALNQPAPYQQGTDQERTLELNQATSNLNVTAQALAAAAASADALEALDSKISAYGQVRRYTPLGKEIGNEIYLSVRPLLQHPVGTCVLPLSHISYLPYHILPCRCFRL